jgi:LysM repeat protein
MGELTKLKIEGFSDPKFSEKITDGEFVTLLNPEKYVAQYKIEQNTTQAPGTSSNASGFNKIAPQEIELDFLFDRTGVIKYPKETAEDDGVIKDIELLKKVVLDYQGENHKPNYVKISWGSLLFKGSLTEMNIEFKLFKPDGTPIRAIAKAKFKEFTEEELRARQENNQSPDLTHVRVVKQGDTLPLMSHRIYGDSKYYLEVAKANNLINFRKLKTGQEIFFPPIQKQL